MEVSKSVVCIYSRKGDFENSELELALENDIFSHGYDNIHVAERGVRRIRYCIILRLNTSEQIKYYEERIKPLLIKDRKDGKLRHNLWR